jgi:RNA polymerase sigma factor (TIGR02999 family)
MERGRTIEVNAILEAPRAIAGPGVPADALFDTLYAELHRIARRELRRQGPGAGLGVTTLLHEAYLTMSGRDGTVFADHARFMGYAARVMRGLIIDDVRRRRSQKRGGLFELTSLVADHADVASDSHALMRIGDALDDLAGIEPELAEIVDLKFFCGFSFAEIAGMRGVSERTIQRSWEKGRLYLYHAIADARPPAARPDAPPQR